MIKKKFLGGSFVRICIFNFIIYLAQFMSNTILPLYADKLGASATLVGMIVSAFSLTSLLMKPVSGSAADSFPRVRILRIGVILLAAAMIGYAFSSTYPILLLFRLVHGLAMGINVTICLAMAADALPAERITSGIAVYSAAQALSSMIGPWVGLQLQDMVGYRVTFMVSAVLVAEAGMLIFFEKPNVPPHADNFTISLKRCLAVEAIPTACIMIFLAAPFVSISSYLVLFARSMRVDGIGIFFTVNAASLLISRPLVGRLTERFGPSKTLPTAICIFAAGMVTISCARGLPAFIAAAVLVAFGYGACQPLIQALCIRNTPSDRRGAASATSMYGSDIGYLCAPFIAGRMVDRLGYSGMFLGMTVFLAAALVLAYVLRDRISAEALQNEEKL